MLIIIFVLLCSGTIFSKKPIKIKASDSLNFGEIVQDSMATTILPDDSNAASITILGRKGESYLVSFPERVNLYGDNGDVLQVYAFQTSNRGQGVFKKNNRDSFTVGATLEEIGFAVPPGRYEGTCTITVQYSN